MREGSVSRAAERLHLGQPAVSAALARLRELFNDPLFVRTRSGMQPTSRAVELASRIAPTLQSMHETLFDGPRFDPATSERTFVLGMPDWVELWLAPLLFAELRRHAPLMRLSIVNTDPFKAAAMLERGEMDMAVSPTQQTPPSWAKRTVLRTTGFVCVYKAAATEQSSKLSLQDYLERTHLLVSYRGAFESSADDWLAQNGERRRVVFATTRFEVLPSLLQDDTTITTVPEPIARRWGSTTDLHISECPVPFPQSDVSAVWLAARDSEEALQWLLSLLGTIAAL